MEKERLLEQINELKNELNQSKSNSNMQNEASQNSLSELLEKLRGKDYVIEQGNNEMRQLKQTLKSQETSIAFYKKRVDDIQEAFAREKQEKMALKKEIKQL